MCCELWREVFGERRENHNFNTRYGSENQNKKNEVARMGIDPGQLIFLRFSLLYRVSVVLPLTFSSFLVPALSPSV